MTVKLGPKKTKTFHISFVYKIVGGLVHLIRDFALFNLLLSSLGVMHAHAAGKDWLGSAIDSMTISLIVAIFCGILQVIFKFFSTVYRRDQ